MNRVAILYNPFLPELKIAINGKRLSSYSALMSYQHYRLEQWCDKLFPELCREINADYEVLCISTEFACAWLRTLADRDPHCVGFTQQPFTLNDSIYDRLGRLELLGGTEEEEEVCIPVINASGEPSMVASVWEILEEQAELEPVSDTEMVWADCPGAALHLQICRDDDRLLREAPVTFVLCDSAEARFFLESRRPVYALVMGVTSRYLGHRNGAVVFEADPDDLSNLLCEILAEEVLCPQLSRKSYALSQDSSAPLTETEKEDLKLLCQVSPVCTVRLPEVMDLGRDTIVEPRFWPEGQDLPVQFHSDTQEVLQTRELVLHPVGTGTAEVSVFVGTDPYPAATGRVKVRQRRLITGISLFPSTLCMPLEGTSSLRMDLTPADGENADEIRWSSDDEAIASVEAVSGVIRAHACGCCRITASTREAAVSAEVEVQPALRDIVCPCSFLEVEVGKQKEWRFRVEPENAYGADTLAVTSSDRTVAEYRGGYVIGKKAGECRIFIKSADGSVGRELHVTVRKKKLFW